MRIRYGFLPDQILGTNRKKLSEKIYGDSVRAALESAYPHCEITVLWKEGKGIRSQAVSISDYDPLVYSTRQLEAIRREVLAIAHRIRVSRTWTHDPSR